MVNVAVVPKRRLELARTLRLLVRDADARYLPNAVPINRPAVRSRHGRPPGDRRPAG